MLFGLRNILGAMVLGAGVLGVAMLALIGVNPAPRAVTGPRLTELGATKPAQSPGSLPGATGGVVADKAGIDAEASHEQAQRLMRAVDAVLQDAAKNRGEARKLPSDADYVLKP